MPSINGDVQKGCHGFYDVANPKEEFEKFLNEKQKNSEQYLYDVNIATPSSFQMNSAQKK